MLDLSIFGFPQFRLNVVGSGMQQIGFFAWYVTTPLILKTVWGWSTFEAGVGMALGQVTASFSAPFGGRWSDRVGTTPPIVTSAIVAAAGPMWFAVTASRSPHFLTSFLPASVLMGLGGGICGTLTTSAALYDLPGATLGAANSVNQLISRVCGVIGVAVAVALLGEAKGPSLLTPAKRVWVMVSLAHLLMCRPYLVRRHTSSALVASVGSVGVTPWRWGACPSAACPSTSRSRRRPCASGTPTIENCSVILIGPISRPLRLLSLAIRPTRSPGRMPTLRPRAT